MIYLRMRKMSTSSPGQRLCLADVADVLADASFDLNGLPVSAPRGIGVWKLDALMLIRDIQARCPNEPVVLLGSAQGTLVCKREARPIGAGGRAMLKGALLVALLLLGSGASNMLASMDAAAPWRIALPYALGVGSGVVIYYALLGRKVGRTRIGWVDRRMLHGQQTGMLSQRTSRN